MITVVRGIYRHFKGKDCFVHGIVTDMGPVDGEVYVLYEPIREGQAIPSGSGQKHIRTLKNFFQTVTLETSTDGGRRKEYEGPRFYLLSDQVEITLSERPELYLCHSASSDTQRD